MKKEATLKNIISALNAELRLAKFSDYSNNGLQIGASDPDKPIKKICAGVDASVELAIAAEERAADFVFVHHGISWGDSLKYLTGQNFERVRAYITRSLPLYGVHLPLDAHPILGHNAVIIRALGVENPAPFALYHGQEIGWCGSLKNEISREELAERFANLCAGKVTSLAYGKETIKTIGVVSGGGASMLKDAIDADLDAFLTGELDLSAHNLAQEMHINAFAAGHYATERFGVCALGEWLTQNFDVEFEFIDFDIPF